MIFIKFNIFIETETYWKKIMRTDLNKAFGNTPRISNLQYRVFAHFMMMYQFYGKLLLYSVIGKVLRNRTFC
jgi:hypothetical protein